MKLPESLAKVADQIDATFPKHGVQLTIGGEPTYVPVDPVGPEWSITALGPTKLQYGRALSDALIAQTLPHAVAVYSPGKTYPGELNPRWAINLVWRKDGEPLLPAWKPASPRGSAPQFCKALLAALRLKDASWLRATDPLDPKRKAWVLPLDHDGRRFRADDWKLGKKIELLRTEGPAGLRLPLHLVPEGASRRAMTVEEGPDGLDVFLPPLLQSAWTALLGAIARAGKGAGTGPILFSGYVPPDDGGLWSKLAVAADPGVLEINLPPCFSCADYAGWMDALERASETAGLRSFKQLSPTEQTGTGGGNHLLFGGPTLEENAFFKNPRWLTSILRYWQHHPSLSYLFTGQYVGSSSQAPRPDESAASLYDLEMAYQFLEGLPAGDNRHLIGETLRHLHTDASGNTHRSEISFDKFWNAAFPGGCRGLIEFRAVESLPRAEWMSAVALLWRALAARLLAKPFTEPLTSHGSHLHDRYFLPSILWADFKAVLRDLAKAGFALPADIYRAIIDWRFPVLLDHREGEALLTIRRAHEGWPLLSETPLEGGSTSRFVDTSIERLELVANGAFAAKSALRVQGRALKLEPFPDGKFGCGLRYRRTALYPSLHPGILPHLPLELEISEGRKRTVYSLNLDTPRFQKSDAPAPRPKAPPARKHGPESVTFDLRLP